VVGIISNFKASGGGLLNYLLVSNGLHGSTD
jgi:hypothetical protein